MNNKFYIYEHTLNNSRYIGKGCGDRCNSKKKRGKTWKDAFKDDFNVKILMDGLTEDEAWELEEFVIDEIGLDNLVNEQKGGKGGWSHINDNGGFSWKERNRYNSIPLAGFKSIREAEEITGIDRRVIGRYLKGLPILPRNKKRIEEMMNEN